MDRTIENELSTYLEIMLNRRLSRLKVASILEAEEKEGINFLWDEHELIRSKYKKIFNEIKWE
ncbi:MAG: hypothetical protein ACXVHS_05415, partial [Methanobacterium sp.]